MPERLTGRVKFYHQERGWGRITCQGRDHVFVHWKNIRGKKTFQYLVEGDIVEFSIGPNDQDRMRDEAKDVILIRDATQAT